eukprot:scaffold193509_cov22-Tisochrysis_lutea.AAC.3
MRSCCINHPQKHLAGTRFERVDYLLTSHTCARLHKSGSIAGGSAAPGRALRSAAARLSSFQASSVLRMVNVTVPASTT